MELSCVQTVGRRDQGVVEVEFLRVRQER